MGILETLREGVEMVRGATGAERSYLLHKDSRGGEWMNVGQWTQHIEKLAIEFVGGLPNPNPKRPDVFANTLADLYEINHETLGKHAALRAPILRQLEYLEASFPQVMEGHKAQGLANRIRNLDVLEKTDPSQILTLLPGGKVQVGDSSHSGITHIREGKDGTLVPFDEFAARGANGTEMPYRISGEKVAALEIKLAQSTSAATREDVRSNGRQNGDGIADR